MSSYKSGEFLGAWNFGKAIQKMQQKVNPFAAMTRPVATAAQVAEQKATTVRRGRNIFHPGTTTPEWLWQKHNPTTKKATTNIKKLTALPLDIQKSLTSKIMKGVKKWHHT